MSTAYIYIRVATKEQLMPRKKPKKHEMTVDELVAFATETKLDLEVFDNCVEDAADSERDLIVENVKSEGLRGIIEFLWTHGYQPGRIEEIIRNGSDDLASD